MKLEERVAIVTGGSGGIGEAICMRLAQERARIVVNYPSHPDRAQVTQEKFDLDSNQVIIVNISTL